MNGSHDDTGEPILADNRESMLQVRKEVVIAQARLNQVSADDHGYLQQITRNQRAISAQNSNGNYLAPALLSGRIRERGAQNRPCPKLTSSRSALRPPELWSGLRKAIVSSQPTIVSCRWKVDYSALLGRPSARLSAWPATSWSHT